jgi:adenosylcobinamide-phosphate synthase
MPVDAVGLGSRSSRSMLLYWSGLGPLFILLGALGLDLLLGDTPGFYRLLPHPVVLVGRAVQFLDGRLNRERRSDRTRLVRGIVAVVVLVLAAAAVGAVLAWALRLLYFGWALEALIVAMLIAQRSLFEHVAAVQAALARDGLAAGRAAVAHIVGRDPESLDEYGVARAAIESLAENFSDGVVGPALYYALFGLPGIMVYKTVNTLDSMIGHRSPRHRHFGWAAARLDDLLNLVPARLSGLLFAAAAGLAPGANAAAALQIMWRDAGKHRSPNAGWPEAAAAGALGLALAGPRRYGGVVVPDSWLGEGRARATSGDIGNALRLYLYACLVNATAILVAALAFGAPDL